MHTKISVPTGQWMFDGQGKITARANKEIGRLPRRFWKKSTPNSNKSNGSEIVYNPNATECIRLFCHKKMILDDRFLSVRLFGEEKPRFLKGKLPFFKLLFNAGINLLCYSLNLRMQSFYGLLSVFVCSLLFFGDFFPRTFGGKI